MDINEKIMKKLGINRTGVVIAIIIAASIVFVCIMFFFGERDPEITIENGRIEINAMYGQDVDISDVADVVLKQESMNGIAKDLSRDNGYNGFGGSTLKGNFSSPETGDCLLFVKPTSAPTILIDRKDDKDIYISYEDSAQTQRIYKQLKEAIS